MYIVPPLWPHRSSMAKGALCDSTPQILGLYWGRNDSEFCLWPVEWRLKSGWAFAQFHRLIRLCPYIPITKFCGVSLRNIAEFLREMSRSFSVNFRGVSPWNFEEKSLGEISDFYFSPRKKHISRRRCSAAKRERRSFFLGWSRFRHCVRN